MEPDPLPEAEGPGPAVLADGPGRRQGRTDRALGVRRHQALGEVPDDDVGCADVALGRVERPRVAIQGVQERPPLRPQGSRSGQGKHERGEGDKESPRRSPHRPSFRKEKGDRLLFGADLTAAFADPSHKK